MKIAVLGLGLLGCEIALRLQRQGLSVRGWNRGAINAEAARARGLEVVADPVETLVDADAAILVLSDAAAIEETLFERLTPDQLAGQTLIQMGTIAPAQSRELADRIQSCAARYLEAPVLGSLPEAREGRLILMAGGEPALFNEYLPVFNVLSATPRHVGAIGQGAALKLAMNQLIAGLTATFALSLGLVRREGLEVELFMDLLRNSALYAPTFDKKLDKYLSGEYSGANFPLKHLLKDVRLFREVAEASALDTTVIAAIETACMRAQAAGFADQDYSALYEAIAPTSQ